VVKECVLNVYKNLSITRLELKENMKKEFECSEFDVDQNIGAK